jgi:hypothetical protein
MPVEPTRVPSPVLAPVQVAYHVPDPAAAAERYAREHGWGPFYLMEHIPLERSLYRGAPGASTTRRLTARRAN